MADDLFGIYGASGCGRGIMPLARAMLAEAGISADRLVFVDDGVSAKSVNGQKVMSGAEFLATPARARFAAIAIANSRIRERLDREITAAGVEPWSVRASNIVIMDEVEIGPGALISPFVTMTSNIRIGRQFHANLYSYVEHDCVVGDYVTFAPGAQVNGNIHIGDHAYLGSGCVIKQGRPGAPLTIGAGAVIGMGAVVTRSVPPGVTVVGNPARPLKGKDA